MKRANKIIFFVFSLALILGAFFTISVTSFIKEIEKIPAYRVGRPPLSSKELSGFLPANVSGPTTQIFADLDGDDSEELVIGYGESVGTGPSAIVKPGLLMYRFIDEKWQLSSQFNFPIDDKFYVNSSSWNILRGIPSFEKRDINGDGKEEIFSRIGIGSDFFHAKAIVVLGSQGLEWLPMVRQSRAVLPIFLDGGTTSEIRKLLLEGVGVADGLSIIDAHGFFDENTKSIRWVYDVYAEHNGIYEYDVDKSANFEGQNQ